MGFNSNKFTKQKFESRTDSISVPALSDWFDEGDKPEWIIKNLTGNEMSLCQEAAQKNKNVLVLAEALVSHKDSDKVDALRSIIGNNEDVTGDLAKRLEMIVYGSIDPKIDMPIAIKLSDNFPVEFMQITNKITILTGMGASKAKPKASGETNQSEIV